jgi:hypothetical protein
MRLRSSFRGTPEFYFRSAFLFPGHLIVLVRQSSLVFAPFGFIVEFCYVWLN